MIKDICIDDNKQYIELGNLVNSNFEKLFNLDDILNSEFDRLIGYYDNSILVGFIHIKVLYETMEIINIVVSPIFRKKGIATSLIEYSISNNNEIKEVLLEVNENNNDAVSVYKKNGFEVISERKNYYGNNTALIMKRDV